MQLPDLSLSWTWTLERLHHSRCSSVGCDVMLHSSRETARYRNPKGKDTIAAWTSHTEVVFCYGQGFSILKSHIGVSSQLLDIIPDIFKCFSYQFLDRYFEAEKFASS
jgi:hypothetical protein